MSAIMDDMSRGGNITKSDEAGVGVGGDGVLDAAQGGVLVRAEGQVVHAVLQQHLDLAVLILVVAAHEFKVFSQLAHADA
jgi:hypothetical protein